MADAHRGGRSCGTTALVMGPWTDDDGRRHEYRRPPGDYEAQHIPGASRAMHQRTGGRVLTASRCSDYGRDGRPVGVPDGELHGGRGAGGADDPRLRLTTDMRLGLEGRSAVAFTRLSDGEQAFAAITWDGEQTPRRPMLRRRGDKIHGTADFWRGWLNKGEFPDHPWRSHLQRAALTLKGLTYAPTGPCWRRPRPPCPRPGESVTGTTGTAGSATPPSPCGGSTPWGSTSRRTASSTSSRIRSMTVRRCR